MLRLSTENFREELPAVLREIADKIEAGAFDVRNFEQTFEYGGGGVVLQWRWCGRMIRFRWHSIRKDTEAQTPSN